MMRKLIFFLSIVSVRISKANGEDGEYYKSDLYKSQSSSNDNSEGMNAWLAGKDDDSSGGGGDAQPYASQQDTQWSHNSYQQPQQAVYPQQQGPSAYQGHLQQPQQQHHQFQQPQQQQIQQNPYGQQQQQLQQFQQPQGQGYQASHHQQQQVEVNQFHPSQGQQQQQPLPQQFQNQQHFAREGHQQQQQGIQNSFHHSQQQMQGQGHEQNSQQGHQQQFHYQQQMQQNLQQPQQQRHEQFIQQQNQPFPPTPPPPFHPQQQQQFPPQQEVVEEESWKKSGDLNPWFNEGPKDVTWSPEDEKFRQGVFSKMKTKWDYHDEDAKKLQNLQNRAGEVMIEKTHLTKDDLNGGNRIQHQTVVKVGAGGKQSFNPQQQLPTYQQHGVDPTFQFAPKDFYKGKIQADPNIQKMLAKTYEIPRRPHSPGSQEQDKGGQGPVGRHSHRMEDPPAGIVYKDRWFDDDADYDDSSRCFDYAILKSLLWLYVTFSILIIV